MTTTYHPGVHRFAVFTVCWTILLFVAGALVTSKDAALSVPDWPKSFGTWFPSLRMLAGGAFFEHSHRVIAAVMGFLVLFLAIWLWKKDPRPWMRWFGVTAVGGVVAQAVLGGQVVRQFLHYWLPVIHASFAQIVFATVLSIAVFTSEWWVSDRPQLEDSGTPSIHSLAILNAAVIYLQVILGGCWSLEWLSGRRSRCVNGLHNRGNSPRRESCCTRFSARSSCWVLGLTGRGSLPRMLRSRCR